MKKRELAYIAIRILSIYTIIQSSIYLISTIGFAIIPFISGKSAVMPLKISVMPLKKLFTLVKPFTILFPFGILLWVFTDKICNHIVIEKQNEKENTNHLTIESIQALAFSIVGLIIFVKAIPELLRIIPQAIVHLDNEPTSKIIRLERMRQIIGNTFELILGFCIFVGGKWLADILNKLRSLGIKQKTQ